MSNSTQTDSSVEAAKASNLSIGDLAERTGVSAATLRVWEARHGFPVPHRRESGHRRYDDDHVAVIQDVVRRRDSGVRLDVAIEQATAARRTSSGPVAGRPTTAAPDAPSVFAALRRGYPGITAQRLSKSTLLGLSWAIEDEFASRAQQAHLFGAFQRVKHYEAAAARWSDLARTARSTFVFADFEDSSRHVRAGRPARVSLPDDHPMSREWSVVCENDGLGVALSAWELPGQHGVRDSDRVFESIWTVERAAVRDAARVCANVAAGLGVGGADEIAGQLAQPMTGTASDVAQVTSLFNRAIAYVDGRGRPSGDR
ncbi:MerR family transcriptional regulator [Nocardioides sp. C4-1]|uniref:MerR family transcriptional regulator n=1 Tax=Nocardioides sp. C4-1 TaxID=3151851 RepID=UPI00326766A5